MKCEGCAYKRGIVYKNGVYSVSCEANGEFPVHEDNTDAFRCDNYAPQENIQPPKDNVCITLKCGRDITVFDKDIKCLKDIGDRLESVEWGSTLTFVQFGNIQFRIDEIVCWGYIGD